MNKPILSTNLDYSYCLNEDTCIHRRGCKRFIGNYTTDQAIFLSNNIVSYIVDSDCIENQYSILDRFRLSDGSYSLNLTT